MKGTIKWYNAEKGYGFIKSDETDGDVFMHRSGIAEPKHANGFDNDDTVTFDIEESPKNGKPCAVNIKYAG